LISISCSGENTAQEVSASREFPELENAIKRSRMQLEEMKTRLDELVKNDGDEKEIDLLQRAVRKKKSELEELEKLLEERKKGTYEPPIYQREEGEWTLYLISKGEGTLTARMKDSGRVVVLYVPQTRRVEGQRVPNTEVLVS
jgi:hypothetical protein